MMSYEFVALYTTTIFVASIIPGPSMILALTHGGRYGARRTVASALGNVTVTLIQAIVSGIGLGAILVASGTTFEIIKWAGVVYLIHMGVTVWRSPAMAFEPQRKQNGSDRLSLLRMYFQATCVTAGNPKAILFFTAIYPQFINPDKAFVCQFAVLLSIGTIVAFCCFMMYAACGEKMVSLFSKSPIRKYYNRFIGGTCIGTGIALAVSRK